ncbi:MAG: Unknown protein [uncultured Sulfurovum sp.]|uniref:Lipoprotein n=1 Tax=uncultured Sulfurovum sp. TaxID=269237 RepID=A0A6S6SIR3_9BACT|nr:MAG: Unknown protein [uncultured Sulfurovum sp.]
MKNRYLSITLLSLVSLMFSACSGKKYFEPERTHSAPSSSYGESIVDLSGDGATLKSKKYIGASGVSSIKLQEGYRFLSESKKYVLSSNVDGVLHIIEKSSGEVLRAVALHTPIVSASINAGVVAYILNNNTFGIYQIEENKKIIENRSERTFAIDTRAASPIFIDNLAVMPMLDGKLIIVDIYNTDNAKVVYLSSKRAFNNVVHLSRMGNTLVAATPRNLITIGNNGKLEYQANISDVSVFGNKVYLFTKEGDVIKLDSQLQELAKKKFKFAHYSVATVLDNKVYALDQQGSLIVLSDDLSQSKVYDLGEVDKPAFITGTKLYKDGDIIELSTLGYE